MSYIGQNLPTDVFGGYATDTFAGDGSATTFTLSQAPFNEQGLIVVINNVIQQPTTNYTVSGTTLTIVGTAVASGDVIYARHTGVALPIGEANALDLQGQSDKLILDADADTTISADTDDQIDFKAGGVCSKHKHKYKWNGFYVVSGKMIVRVWKDDQGLVDETLLNAGDWTRIKPGEYHQFEGVEDGIAFELYWAQFDHDDIEREYSGSKKND